MPDHAAADAPGRVNLIGEHTDYHDGFVLPAIIPQRTYVTVLRRGDRQVRARSAAVADAGCQVYEVGHEAAGRGWLDYVQGVTVALARHHLVVPGFDLEIESDVPVGAGVSSSAALEVSLLRALRSLCGFDFDDVTLAQMARLAETDFVGAPVGIMDQMAASLGRDREALFLDTRTLAVAHLPLPPSAELVVIDSGITHAHAGGEYVERRRESFEAAALLGVEKLRDLSAADATRIDALPATLARRARHIVSENARVLAAVEALRDDDVDQLGALFAASHASMRDDYEITTPGIDALVRIGQEHPRVFGARMTGGGFGGSVVMLAEAGLGCEVACEVRAAYQAQTGHRGEVLVPRADERRRAARFLD